MAALSATALLAVAMPAAALDLFIGTVAIENGDVVLTRCDLVQNRYVLKDLPKAKAVATLLTKLPTMKGPVYAEVIGEYAEDGKGDNLLNVDGIENVTAGKTCHLLDLAR
jgi:hypothetical protein